MPKIVLGIKLYTATEVGELLGVTRATASKYIKEDRLKSTRIGGRNYVSEEALKEFLLPQPK